ncbi:diaminohydroxyphosphoribosylaminopyrimidine deaminase/5-amino-6-(5-phosphoribosylamino)uracil reductase [Kribbella sp. VKM Ac-2571]|uniref:bifunctional diaminohydroxyphosphoribosylaminopyrimidine deaminase/5-amino-6-(5-phosphoribosylamino)uracil reductase RibD n=1 Tax=Kribbella sp. VKM Ac-2571 TaxID=2512222 RepID=UPI0010EDFE1A|nr:bifunctional diaminohydroxyphosphoribosylaminopyrimidine deaminase/5-amino-6-(5-phosphoribosylamino)uracil reductase RibD [Kribbella sp. VKM Ac-2571]TDO63848.1 diaminohydroxyphosphoribosylaminopyrimidine deaminase/5-amino-6-(5-phosphoribosylamino)uracil reductase [Kribbella sp. VKM Ac-2571]
MNDASPIDIAWMRRAVELAARGTGSTHPNPVVGCVITGRDGHPVGEGFHAVAGGPHAEIEALRMAGARARGGTAYVTLEPCNHTGRTGPCADALIEAEVARVVYAVPDPNRTASGGADKLRNKNIDVVQGVLQSEAEAVNHVWLHSVRMGRPFVTWKFATTLDGRSAAPDRSSKWITGPIARADVHRQRAECDAIAVGTQTVLVDDPELTVRDEHDVPAARQPLRVVVGDREIPPTARVRNDRAETLLLPTHDPAEVLRQLDDRQIRHLWLEGGPTLAAAFLRAGLVDQIVAYVAPAVLGSGYAAVGDLGAESIDHLRRFKLADVTRLGDDVRLTLVPLGGK